MLTFKKGIHTRGRKELTKDIKIEKMPAPKIVYIPLTQHIGAECEPVVKNGDYVKKGQIIAASEKLSGNVISSVSGKVVDTVLLLNIHGTKAKHIKIENDFLETEIKLPKLNNPDEEEIIARIKQAGIVGMGGAAFPSHIKINPSVDKKIETLIINAAECEPYITCDYRIILEYAEEFLRGCLLLKKACKAENLIIAVENNKPDAIELLQSFNLSTVTAVKAKYPQGAEKQLIYAVTKKKVPPKTLPLDIGVVVNNAHTAYAVYQAVDLGITSYERVVTVSGNAVKNPKNLIIRTGTQVSEVLEFCGGLRESVAEVIVGGPMMGFSQFNLNSVVTKATTSVLFLTEKEISKPKTYACINCGRCAKVCPMNLMPMYIDGYSLANELKLSKKYGALDCMECGCCSYVCPSKRPIVQSIKLAKKMIKEKNI